MIQAVRELGQLQRRLSDSGLALPKIRWKILAAGLYADSSHGDLVRLARASQVHLTRPESGALRRQARWLWLYSVLLAHDDDLDRDAITADETIERLACCLVLFWRGLYDGEPDLPARLDARHSRYQAQVGDADTTPFSTMVRAFATQVPTEMPWRARHLNELGAYELGRGLAVLRAELARVITLSAVSAHDDFLDRTFLTAALAQIASARQKEITDIRWLQYLDIAVGKSTAYLDIGASLRAYLTPELYTTWRLSPGRFCEQIYLDDLMDLDSDARDGIFGAPHVFLAEQARIAERVLAVRDGDDFQSFKAIAETVDKAGLMREHFRDVLIFAPKSRAGSGHAAHASADDAKLFIRTALCNSRAERTMPLNAIAARRRAEGKALIAAVGVRDAKRTRQILFRSGILGRFLTGLREIIVKKWPLWRRMVPIHAAWIIAYWGVMSAWFFLRSVGRNRSE